MLSLTLKAGQIVLADWRGGALPKQPNKRRPAIVVEDDSLFVPGYPNAILVPLSDDATLIIPDLAVPIQTEAELGSWLGRPRRHDVQGKFLPSMRTDKSSLPLFVR
jgi:hypothetical protein